MCFGEDRSFTKTRLDLPVEGTQITLFLAGDDHRHAELVEEIRATLSHWCSHSETEITFEDRSADLRGEVGELVRINEPFEVFGDCLTRVEHQGTEIVLAYDDTPAYGFYNRGLALARSKVGDDLLGPRARRFSRVGFKIKSRYLEHTLSRETVLKDDNYDKAIRLLVAAADGPLRESLLRRVEALAEDDQWELSELSEWARLAWHLVLDEPDVVLAARDRTLLRTVDGAAVSLADVEAAQDRDGRVLLAPATTELTARLSELGVPVLLGYRPGTTLRDRRLREEQAEPASEALAATFELVVRYLRAVRERSLSGQVRSLVGEAQVTGAARLVQRAAGWLPRALPTFGGRKAGRALSTLASGLALDAHTRAELDVARPEEVYLPVVPDEAPDAPVEALVTAAGGLLDRVGAGYRRLATGRLGVPDTDPPLFVLGRQVGPVMARPPEHIEEEEQARRPEALINRDHPHFRSLLGVAADRPGLAAYCLAKGLLLTEDRLLHKDLALVQAAGGY